LPLRICRNAVRTAELLLRTDQCWLGVENDGSVKSRPGKRAGLSATLLCDESVVFPTERDSDEGWWR
jgi:hypothetical protein